MQWDNLLSCRLSTSFPQCLIFLSFFLSFLAFVNVSNSFAELCMHRIMKWDNFSRKKWEKERERESRMLKQIDRHYYHRVDSFNDWYTLLSVGQWLYLERNQSMRWVTCFYTFCFLFSGVKKNSRVTLTPGSSFDSVKDVETDGIRFFPSLWYRGCCLEQPMSNGQKIVLIKKKWLLKVRKTIWIFHWIMSSKKSVVCFSLLTTETTRDKEEKSNVALVWAQITVRCHNFHRMFRTCSCIDQTLRSPSSDHADPFHCSWWTSRIFRHASSVKRQYLFSEIERKSSWNPSSGFLLSFYLIGTDVLEQVYQSPYPSWVSSFLFPFSSFTRYFLHRCALVTWDFLRA